MTTTENTEATGLGGYQSIDKTLYGGNPSVGIGIIADNPNIDTLLSSLKSHSDAKLYGLFAEMLMFHRSISLEELKGKRTDIPCPDGEQMPETLSRAEQVKMFAEKLNVDYAFLLNYRVRTIGKSEEISKLLELGIEAIKASKVKFLLVNHNILGSLNKLRDATIPAPHGGYTIRVRHREEDGYWLVRHAGRTSHSPDVGLLAPREWLLDADKHIPTFREKDGGHLHEQNLRAGILKTEGLFEYSLE